MESSDEALVLACRRGDTTAWETIVTRYQRLIYSIPRRAGLSEDAAADVFQHVFMTLVEKLETIEQPARLSAWLVTTARRETWRVSRQQRAVASGGDDSDSEASAIPDSAPLPDEQLLRLEAQHRVRNAVMQLDERCRTLLTLLFYQPEPPPYAAIAARLGTSEGSIGPTRARCLEKVRKQLDGTT